MHLHPDDARAIRAEFERLVNLTPAELSAWLETPESRRVGMVRRGEAESVGRQSARRILAIRATPVDASLPPAGSPVSAVVVTEGQDGSLSVPADAVQNVDGSSAVFVAVEGGFKAQPVLAGRRAGDRIEILGGLSGNERIVGANAFLLKAELAKGEAEHGH